MKKVLLISGIVLFALLAACGVYLYRNPFVRTVLKLNVEAIFSSSKPDWKTARSPDSVLELESPFPVSWSKEEKALIKGGRIIILTGRSPANRTGFGVHATGTFFSGTGFTIVPSTILAEMMNSQMKMTALGSTYRLEPVTCSGLPATLVNHDYNMKDLRYHSQEMLVTSETRIWRISVYYTDPEKQKEWVRRVLESIRINPPDTKQ
jgi:hypothetical protein